MGNMTELWGSKKGIQWHNYTHDIADTADCLLGGSGFTCMYQIFNLVPRPLPRFYLATMIFLHDC